MWLRLALGLSAALIVACTTASSPPPEHEAPPSTAASWDSPSATFAPAPAYTSGQVVRLVPGGIVITQEGGEKEVSLVNVVRVWKETSVPPSGLEAGDRLLINGVEGSPFMAKYVWANIAQVDGVIREIDDSEMSVELARGQIIRVEFSEYLELGTADGGRVVTRDELIVGRQVGMVLYRPPTGLPRATRIW